MVFIEVSWLSGGCQLKIGKRYHDPDIHQIKPLALYSLPVFDANRNTS